MKKTFFIAGTDTDVGKTCVATALLNLAGQQGLQALGIKPVAAGAEETSEGLRNADALALMQASTVELDYDQLNPVCLKSPIAPHIAAEQEGRRITVSRLAGFCRGASMLGADLTVVEGAGGWRVPLNDRETMADLARELQIPVILVVGMKLGCLNHALLSVEAITRDGLPLAGWVANAIDPNMACFEENIESLTRRIKAPCLGVVPWQDELSGESFASYLDIGPITG